MGEIVKKYVKFNEKSDLGRKMEGKIEKMRDEAIETGSGFIAQDWSMHGGSGEPLFR